MRDYGIKNEVAHSLQTGRSKILRVEGFRVQGAAEGQGNSAASFPEVVWRMEFLYIRYRKRPALKEEQQSAPPKNSIFPVS